MNLKNKILPFVLLSIGLLTSNQAIAFYNPQTGRWLSRDPKREDAGLNLYNICRNDLINIYDVKGLSYQKCGFSGPPISATAWKKAKVEPDSDYEKTSDGGGTSSGLLVVYSRSVTRPFKCDCPKLKCASTFTTNTVPEYIIKTEDSETGAYLWLAGPPGPWPPIPTTLGETLLEVILDMSFAPSPINLDEAAKMNALIKKYLPSPTDIGTTLLKDMPTRWCWPVVLGGSVHNDKTGQKILQIQPHMGFGGGLAPAVLGPVQAVGHQFHGRAINHMDELRVQQTDRVTPRTEGARLIQSPGLPRYFGDFMRRNEIANLAQNVKPGPCRFDFFVFHACLVAGSNGQANTFFQFPVGWL